MCFNASCLRLWHVSCISLSHRNRHISAFRAQRRKAMKYFLICSFLTVVRYPCIFPSAGSSEFQTSGCTAVETVCVCVCDLPWPPAWPRPSCWLLNVPSELLKLVNQCVEVEERWQLCSLAPPACTRYSLHMCFCFLSPNEKKSHPATAVQQGDAQQLKSASRVFTLLFGSEWRWRRWRSSKSSMCQRISL